MKAVLTILLLFAVSSCRTVEGEMEKSVSLYGHRAHVILHNEWMITGELLVQERDHLWLVSLRQRVVTIPLRDVYTIEVLDTDINAYVTPTVMLLGTPWIIIGFVGAGYTGEVEWIPAGFLIGGLLTLVPTALNEAGMTNPEFTANDVAMGHISPFLRYPFRTVSDTLRTQILVSYGQATPDTLRMQQTESGIAGE